MAGSFLRSVLLSLYSTTDLANAPIREGLLISRPRPKCSARVIQTFSIQLFPSEEGYIAASDLCNITEIEETVGEAVRSYLYSLVDELVWLQKQKESLSEVMLGDLRKLQLYLSLV